MNNTDMIFTDIPSGLKDDRVKFRRCVLKAGDSVSPTLSSEDLIVLLFDGQEGYITTSGNIYNIKEASMFCPDFDRVPYTIHAVKDIQYMMCTFKMNDWDKEFYNGWHLTFPFFSKYSDGVRFRHGERSAELSSYSLIQPFQIGHLSLNYITGVGGSIVSEGNTIQHRWLYPVNDASFTISVSGKEEEGRGNETMHYIPMGSPCCVKSDASGAISCFCIEYFEDADIQKNYLAQIYNGRMTEIK